MQPVNPDISLARTLDTAFYNDPQLIPYIREQLFVPSWQLVGDLDHVSDPGSCYPFTLLPGWMDEPLLLTRDEKGIHCLSNVCTHRGNLLVYEPCRSPQIRCKYHGRQFSLDGQFRSMPEFKEVQDFPAENDHLPKLPVFQWGPMVFTTLAGAGTQNRVEEVSESYTRYLGDMMERLSWLPMQEFKFRPDLSRDFPVKANWALYCENYLEGFHIPFVHAGLNAVIDYGNYTTELFGRSNLQLGIAKDDEDCFDLPERSPDFGKKIAAYYFFVFPNLMFNFYPWGLSVNIVEPNGVDQTKVRFLTYMWKEKLYNKGAGSGLDTVEFEDEEVVENVQKGVRSRLYKFGRYSVTREQGTHHFHRMICEAMKL